MEKKSEYSEVALRLKGLSDNQRKHLERLLHVSNSIREIMKFTGITAIEFCKLLGVPENEADDFCSGNYNYSMWDLANIDEVFAKTFAPKLIDFPNYEYLQINPREREESIVSSDELNSNEGYVTSKDEISHQDHIDHTDEKGVSY